MQSYPNVIAGRLVNSPQQDDVINPALGKPFATCARGTTELLNEAIEGAAAAFKTWRKDEAFRRQKLNECAAAIQGRAPELAQLLTQEQGKPVTAAMGMVDDAKKQGAKIEVGGQRLESPGYFYPPTIVTNVHAGMRLVDDEQFGTALPVIKYSNLDDALEQANRTHYGLGASIWTADAKRGDALVQEIESGTGWVNQHLDLGPSTPFGGCKWSGLGYENGKWGYHEFTEMQVVNTKK